jgi:hypothetical protein
MIPEEGRRGAGMRREVGSMPRGRKAAGWPGVARGRPTTSLLPRYTGPPTSRTLACHA